MSRLTPVIDEWTQTLNDLYQDQDYISLDLEVNSGVLKRLRDQEEGLEKAVFYGLAPSEGDHVAVTMTYLEDQIAEHVRRIAELHVKRDTIGRDIQALLMALEIMLRVKEQFWGSDSDAEDPTSPPDLQVAVKERRSLEDKLAFGECTAKEMEDKLIELLKTTPPESSGAWALKTDLITQQFQNEMTKAALRSFRS